MGFPTASRRSQCLMARDVPLFRLRFTSSRPARFASQVGCGPAFENRRMAGLVIILVTFLLVSFCAAWLVNALVGLMSGEKPGDTGRLWIDMFFRGLGTGLLGVFGRALNTFPTSGWARLALYVAGAIALLWLLVHFW